MISELHIVNNHNDVSLLFTVKIYLELILLSQGNLFDDW